MEKTINIDKNIIKYYKHKPDIKQSEIDKQINKCKNGRHKPELFFDYIYCKFCGTKL